LDLDLGCYCCVLRLERLLRFAHGALDPLQVNGIGVSQRTQA
jgi:hypothetical protein